MPDRVLRTTMRMNRLLGLRELPRVAWVLFAGTFVNRFGTFVGPMLALYLTRSGLSIAQTGVVVGSYGAGYLATSLLGGHLADRIGRRNTIALSMFASAATMLALSQAGGRIAIVVLTFAAGVAAELYRPASSALLADVVTAEQRVLAFGLYRLAINLGFAVGPATAGFLAERSFSYVFLGDALTSVAFGVVALVALPHGRRSRASAERIGEGIRVALADRRLTAFLLASVCITWVYFQQTSTLPIHVARAGFSPSQFGLLMSVNGALIVLFEIVLTLWLQRFPPVPVIAVGYALMGVGWALTGLVHTFAGAAVAVAIWTIAEMVFAPMTGAYVTELAPEHCRGRYHGLHMLTYSVGMLAGPMIGTAIYSRSETLLWTACALSGGVSALVLLGWHATGARAAGRGARSPVADSADGAAPAARRPGSR